MWRAMGYHTYKESFEILQQCTELDKDYVIDNDDECILKTDNATVTLILGAPFENWYKY